MDFDSNSQNHTAQSESSQPSRGSRPFGLRNLAPKRAWAWVLAVVLAGGLVLEFAGRMQGLHRPVIYEPTAYGYRVVPNQELLRFENRSFYNAQGLRSEAMTVAPAAGKLRVLCLGDSVTNGGAITDQADTYPYQLQAMLNRHRGDAEVLNASAPGWAVGNELGWLHANGTFGSRYVVLALSTHDLFQARAPSSIVGSHQSFPGAYPYLAVQDLLHHYLIPMLKSHVGLSSVEGADPGVADRTVSAAQAEWNLTEIRQIESVVRSQGGSLIVMYLDEPMPLHFETAAEAARNALFAEMNRLNVPVLTLRAELARFERRELFRDAVHPNPLGNRVIASAIARHLSDIASIPAPAGLSALVPVDR